MYLSSLFFRKVQILKVRQWLNRQCGGAKKIPWWRVQFKACQTVSIFFSFTLFLEGKWESHRVQWEKWSIKESVILYKKFLGQWTGRTKRINSMLKLGQMPALKSNGLVTHSVCIMSGWAVSSSVALSPQQSVLPFSSELWILSRVFLMRRAVSRAEGFWYQHSFISFTRADRVCDHTKTHRRLFWAHGEDLSTTIVNIYIWKIRDLVHFFSLKTAGIMLFYRPIWKFASPWFPQQKPSRIFPLAFVSLQKINSVTNKSVLFGHVLFTN